MHAEHRLSLPGPAGPLEACLTLPPNEPPAGLALLCHPHPQYGGSMQDGVLQSLEQALLNAGWASLRFNFRGVGASAGQFDGGTGEVEDVLAMLNASSSDGLLAVHLGDSAGQQRLLVGYSFGAAMAWQAQHSGSAPLAGVWLVAPPLSAMELIPAASKHAVALIVGDNDDFCAPAKAADWLAATGQPEALHLLQGGDHFFSGVHGALADVASHLLQRASAVDQ